MHHSKDGLLTSLLTPEEAIRYLALDKQSLRSPRESLRWLCRSKKLRFAKIGRYVRFRREWLDELIDSARNDRGESRKLT